MWLCVNSAGVITCQLATTCFKYYNLWYDIRFAWCYWDKISKFNVIPFLPVLAVSVSDNFSSPRGDSRCMAAWQMIGSDCGLGLGKNVQSSMKAWSRNPRRGDLPMRTHTSWTGWIIILRWLTPKMQKVMQFSWKLADIFSELHGFRPCKINEGSPCLFLSYFDII